MSGGKDVACIYLYIYGHRNTAAKTVQTADLFVTNLEVNYMR